MPAFIDLTGKRFGEWTVLAYAGRQRWHCRCDCGKEKNVNGANLRDGKSKQAIAAGIHSHDGGITFHAKG